MSLDIKRFHKWDDLLSQVVKLKFEFKTIEMKKRLGKDIITKG